MISLIVNVIPVSKLITIFPGLTIERYMLVSFPIPSGLLGLGKRKAGSIMVTILVSLVMAFHAPTLRFLNFDPVKVLKLNLK